MATANRSSPLARAVLRTQSDERLIKLSRQGGERAFEEIVRRYRPGLVAFASAYAPPSRAEDVVQESLVKSWEALRSSSAEIRLKPWLYTIVRNRALNARRDARPHEPLDEAIDGVSQPPEIVLGAEQLARVVAAVNALPDSQREALVQCAVEGRTHEQVAAALSTSTGAVRQLVYRARMTLRNGCGLLVPVPILAALSAGGSGPAAGGAVALAGAGGAGGAGGGSLALKSAAVIATGALAVGGGLAIERSSPSRAPGADGEGRPAPVRTHEAGAKQLAAANPASSAVGSDPGGGPGQAPGAGEDQGGNAAGGDPGDDSADSAARGRSGGGGSDGDDPGHASRPHVPEGSGSGSPPAHGGDHGEIAEEPHEGQSASAEGYEDEPPEQHDPEQEESGHAGSDAQDSGSEDPYPDEPDLGEPEYPPVD